MEDKYLTHFYHSGPSYKRGPPKGYIHAIEQRWHQVESLLGAVMQCSDPRVQSVVTDLRRDDLAREILARVDAGPYVSTLRMKLVRSRVNLTHIGTLWSTQTTNGCNQRRFLCICPQE